MIRRNRSRFRAFLSSPFTLVGALILLFFLSRAAWHMRAKAAQTAERLDQAREELAALEARRDEAEAQIGRLSTPEGIRAEVRDRYHAVEPGESVAVIVDRQATGTAAGGAAEATSTAVERHWWSWLGDLF